jgi:predicted ArsR family transcriptional regulator
MILNRVTGYLKLNKRASVRDMAAVLNIAPEALRDILSRLEHRGHVTRLASGTQCGGGCSKCSPQSIELYEWCK